MTTLPPTNPNLGSPGSPANPAQPGDPFAVYPKNPLSSTAVWGLLVMLISWAAQKWLPSWIQSEAVKAALEIATFLIGFLVALWGRWRATRPLSFLAISSVAQPITTTMKSILLPFLAPFLAAALFTAASTALITCSVGCNPNGPPPTPKMQLAQAENDFALVLQSLTSLHAAGLISDSQMAALRPYAQAGYAGLARAEAALQAGDSAAAAEAQGTAQAALTFLQQYERAKNPAKAATQPAEPIEPAPLTTQPAPS